MWLKFVLYVAKINIYWVRGRSVRIETSQDFCIKIFNTYTSSFSKCLEIGCFKPQYEIYTLSIYHVKQKKKTKTKTKTKKKTPFTLYTCLVYQRSIINLHVYIYIDIVTIIPQMLKKDHGRYWLDKVRCIWITEILIGNIWIESEYEAKTAINLWSSLNI